MIGFYRKIIFLLVYVHPFLLAGQHLHITGKVLDSANNTPVISASVVLYNYYTKAIKSYAITKEDGSFEMQASVPQGIYQMKVRHLNYYPIEKEIVLADSIGSKLTVSFAMVPKINQLKEVVIKKTSPIIIKKDTIIYDIQYWAQKNDPTIEDVLKRIEGFKILPDGSIKVNGKMIRKVLIDGKEVANAGASLLTKSIDPENVKEVEVRFNEKSDKIKESLLDTKKYVVLDIKMKKDVDLSFFGKTRITAGYQESVRPGGYANLFSLHKKISVHLFAEHDDFGYQTISLLQIKNIGREALQKMFELPVDFNLVTQREAYHSELYGFKDYTHSSKNIVGISSKFDLSEHWSLFFGSYNSLDFTKQARSVDQAFKSVSQHFKKNKSFRVPSSKNKLEIRFDASDIKLLFNTNFVYDESDLLTIDKLTNPDINYSFDNKKNALSFYNNLSFEYKISSKLGLELKASHSLIRSQQDIDFKHNNPKHFFLEKGKSGLYELVQKIRAQARQINAQAMLQYRSKIGLVEVGALFENRALDYQSTGTRVEYAQDKETYTFKRGNPYLSHSIGFGDFTFSNKVGFSFFEYSDILNTQEKSSLWNYYSSLRFSPNDMTITVSYNNKLSSFPLKKLTKANTILNFQTVEVRADRITPRRESVINVDFYKTIDVLGLDVNPYALFVNSQTSNRLITSQASFLELQRDQLSNSYQLFSIILTKKLKKIPITFILEPEAVFNDNENIVDSTSYRSKTKRWLMGFKLNTNFKDKWYNFKIYPKYTKFDFENTLSDSRSSQEMLSLSFNSTLTLLKDKLFVDLGLRHVYFFGNIKSKYTNINVKILGVIKKFNWFLMVSNITDDRNFIQQSIFPNYFISQVSQVFGRFVKLGIEYKFK